MTIYSTYLYTYKTCSLKIYSTKTTSYLYTELELGGAPGSFCFAKPLWHTVDF